MFSVHYYLLTTSDIRTELHLAILNYLYLSFFCTFIKFIIKNRKMIAYIKHLSFIWVPRNIVYQFLDDEVHNIIYHVNLEKGHLIFKVINAEKFVLSNIH